jgi:tetratricopeptide (TPR) repeat protein
MLKPTTSFILLLLWWLSFALPRQATAQDATELTPTELFNAARSAFDAGDWAQAETLFTKFIDTYGGVAETAEAAKRMKPLLVSTKLRQKKYAETLPLLEEVLKDPQLDPGSSDELAFWKGICQFQVQDFDAAQKAFGEFYGEKLPYVVRLNEAQRRVHAGRRTESVVLYGMCFIMKDDFKGAATFFGSQIAPLRQVNREAAGRATVLRLHALLESNDDAAALALVKDSAPHIQEITQAVAYHTLCLQLGSRLLESGKSYDAIYVLQRIWNREKLLSTQQASLASFTTRLEVARKTPGQEYLAFQYESLISRIQRELEQFEKLPSFDPALRLRIASAYRDLGRYRECALILDDMLQRMPPDDVVKKATLSLVQCWMQIQRWDKAVAAADTWIEKFGPTSPDELPTVLFLKASALQGDHRPDAAEMIFAEVHQKHPQHEMAARALFMEGICLLEQDLNREAEDAFSELPKKHPTATDLIEESFYWTGMGRSFDKQHAQARSQMEAYLKRYPQHARYTQDAQFRIAFSSFGLAEYPRAIREIQSFISANRGSQYAEEGKLLLGDALGAEGRIDEAIKAYQTIDRAANPRFHEDAWFRTGNIYKLAERFDAMRSHYERFILENPRSMRIAEAVYWIGWTYDSAGKREEARTAYWDAIEKHGNTADTPGVEDILTALPRLYPGPEGREELQVRLGDLSQKAGTLRPLLALRTGWARAVLWRKADPDNCRRWLLELAPRLNAKEHSPRIVADVADALRESGRLDEARKLYVDLRKWHPRAFEKDRVFLGLGLIALSEKKPEEALKALARFETETLNSPLLGEVASIKGGLFVDQGKYKEAQAEMEKILVMPTVPRQLKATTLLKLGDLMTAQKQDLKATAYFERVYISYGKYLPEVALAYFKRAEALDRLNEPRKAEAVYRELAERLELSAQSVHQKAIVLLDARDPSWRDRRPVEGAETPQASTSSIP